LNQTDTTLRSKFKLLERLNRELAASSGLSTVLQQVVDSACELVGARRGALGMFDTSGGVEQFITHGGTPQEKQKTGDLLKDLGVLELLDGRHEPLRLADLSQHTRRGGHPPPTSFLGSPICFGQEVLGNLYLIDKADAVEFTADDEALIGLLASQAAAAIHATRRLAHEQEALAALKQQAQAIDQVQESVVSTDLDGRVTGWNKGAGVLFGYTAKEALGRHISFVYPPDQQDFLQNAVIAPLKKKGRHEIEVRMLRKSGERFHAHLSLSLLRDDRGAVTGMIGFSVDITERRQAERALQARARQQKVVAELGLYALTNPEPDSLMKRAVTEVAETLGVDFSKVLELLPDGKELLLRVGVGWKKGYVGRARVSAGANSQAGYTLLSEEPVIAENLQTETRFHGPPLLSEHGVVSGISVIIQGKDRPYGILGAHTSDFRAFSKDDVNFVQAVANVLAAAIERRGAETRLRESEERFRQLAEHIQEVFWMTTAEGAHVIYVSPTYEEIWGRGRQSLYEHPEEWLQAVHEEDRERVAAAFRQESLAAGGFDQEYRIIRPDGSVRWIRDRGFPVRSEQGNVYRIAGIAQDITRLREADEMLRRQAELLDLAHDAVFVRDWHTGVISYWSRGAERMYGWTPAEALGKTSYGLLNTQFPQPLSEIEDHLTGWGRWEGELVQQRRDGSRIVADSRWALQRDHRGQPVAILEINSDITDRKQAEQKMEQERLQSLVNISPVGIFVADSAGKVLVVNREAERIMGIPFSEAYALADYQRAVVVQRPDGTVIPPEKLAFRRALNKGETVRAEEVVLRLPGGRNVPALINATPFYGARGEIVGAVAAIQDMTPVEELERLRTEFLGMVSHELRSPLSAIKGSASLALGSPIPLEAEQARELFEAIDKQVDEIADLVANLLDVTRIEAGTLSVRPEPLDLGRVIEEAKSRFAGTGGTQEVRVHVPEGVPAVRADEHRIGQVLINLLNNAGSFSPPNAPISVSVEHDNHFVTVRVADQGLGVPREKLPQLFKKFAQVQTEDRRAQPGTGLGLAICKGIVEAHGGRIWADSLGQGKGTTVSFTLPLPASETNEAPEAARPEEDRSGKVARRGEQLRILAVDDDPRILQYLRRALGEAGYGPIVSNDPVEAINILELEKPDLLILDVLFPGTSGFDVLKRIREFSAVPVIFLTGRDEEEDMVRALKMGADDYMTKPFSSSELLARIEAVLRRRLAPESTVQRPYVAGDLVVDFAERAVNVGGRPVHLSAIEYKLLYELATHAGRVLTYEQILQRVWGSEYVGDSGLLRSSIRNLRRKLGDDGHNPRYVLTEIQVGYRMPKPQGKKTAYVGSSYIPLP
jgi:PAS domain S-box-containing protein